MLNLDECSERVYSLDSRSEKVYHFFNNRSEKMCCFSDCRSEKVWFPMIACSIKFVVYGVIVRFRWEYD